METIFSTHRPLLCGDVPRACASADSSPRRKGKEASTMKFTTSLVLIGAGGWVFCNRMRTHAHRYVQAGRSLSQSTSHMRALSVRCLVPHLIWGGVHVTKRTFNCVCLGCVCNVTILHSSTFPCGAVPLPESRLGSVDSPTHSSTFLAPDATTRLSISAHVPLPPV